jgi:hypothetical protein
MYTALYSKFFTTMARTPTGSGRELLQPEPRFAGCLPIAGRRFYPRTFTSPSLVPLVRQPGVLDVFSLLRL